MTARDDYPLLEGPTARAAQRREMLDEIDRLKSVIQRYSEMLTDLKVAESLDLDLAFRHAEMAATGLWPDLVVAAGLVCNVTKKLNRGDEVAPELVAEKVGRVLAEAFAFADASSIDLLGEMTGKVAVCEARWGGSRG